MKPAQELSADGLWADVSARLRDALNDGTFHTWFSEAEAEDLDDETFVVNLSGASNFVGAPSKFVPGGPSVPPTVTAVLSPPPVGTAAGPPRPARTDPAVVTGSMGYPAGGSWRALPVGSAPVGSGTEQGRADPDHRGSLFDGDFEVVGAHDALVDARHNLLRFRLMTTGEVPAQR